MSREKFEAWGMSDPDLSETLKSEVYASIAWMAWQAASKASEQQLAAVVAELSAIEAIHNDAVFITDEHYEQCPPEVQKMIGALAALRIPAYDAYLAEVRASGVEMFANHIALYNSDSEQHANLFAAQLRQGAAL